MCHSHDDGISLTGSVEDIERKTFKNELACAVFRKRGGVWSFPNPRYGFVNSLHECDSAKWTAFVIPMYERREVRRERQGEA